MAPRARAGHEGAGQGSGDEGSGHEGAIGGRRVLVVDDDAAILRSLRRGLRLNRFSVEVAACGMRALEEVRRRRVDAVVLDVSLPDVSGIEVCRTLRDEADDVPVLMLSALDETADRIAGLQAGGDDYLVKPFALQELVLRLNALLRRRPAEAGQQDARAAAVRAGGLTLRPAERRALLDGRELDLTPREFSLLEVLARNAGIVLGRDRLLELVWGYDAEVRSDAVDTFVSYLRRKTETGGRARLVHTVRGVGFVLRDEEEHARGGGASDSGADAGASAGAGAGAWS
ncbi:response regulator transcription factor [Streptomyces sp. ODS28]|uniref:response regulator transcription factor n=1 Tax=Streptomyces sp. ODS28 TaxID=3136688 RepID=UPI0031E98E31